MEEGTQTRTPDDRTTRWTALGAASLAGVLALPLAYLHNQRSFTLELTTQGGRGWWALIADAAAGAFLAALGARLCAPPPRAGGWRFLVVWCAALLGGCGLGLGAELAAFCLDGHPFGSAQSSLLTLMVLLALALSGVFCFYGVPLAVNAELRRRVADWGWRRALWFAGAALAGGAIIMGLVDEVIERSGVGVEGSGLLVMLVWPYFGWGAGLGAAFAHSRLSRDGAGEADGRRG
jgi:hypothetical protein